MAGPGGYSLVTGPQKLIQDLKNWILEARGTDKLHPDFGSALDGELLPDGTWRETNIGSTVSQFQLLSIESELRRILTNYQQQQIDRLQREANDPLLQGKNTFAPGEILHTVNNVMVQQIGDTVVAKISITTTDGNNITFVNPLGV